MLTARAFSGQDQANTYLFHVESAYLDESWSEILTGQYLFERDRNCTTGRLRTLIWRPFCSKSIPYWGLAETYLRVRDCSRCVKDCLSYFTVIHYIFVWAAFCMMKKIYNLFLTGILIKLTFAELSL